MIVVTGAAGFIGSCMIQKLNEAGYTDILAVDDFTRPDKQPNIDNKKLWGQVHRDNFIRWLERHHAEVDTVIHLGARTDTTEHEHGDLRRPEPRIFARPLDLVLRLSDPFPVRQQRRHLWPRRTGL